MVKARGEQQTVELLRGRVRTTTWVFFAARRVVTRSGSGSDQRHVCLVYSTKRLAGLTQRIYPVHLPRVLWTGIFDPVHNETYFYTLRTTVRTRLGVTGSTCDET